MFKLMQRQFQNIQFQHFFLHANYVKLEEIDDESYVSKLGRQVYNNVR